MGATACEADARSRKSLPDRRIVVNRKS